jgi:dihydrofolate synthase/folylpolyglutamate synthase
MGKQILVQTALVGRHQLRNVALAISSAEELSKQGFLAITPETIELGIRQTRWPGRFQVIPSHAGWPELVLDVAHNPAGAWALRAALSECYEQRPLIFVFGAMRDKAISEMAEILFPLANYVVATRPDNPRSASPAEIQQAAHRTGIELDTTSDAATALDRAKAMAQPDGIIVITGSIYLVGEVMRLLDMRPQGR